MDKTTLAMDKTTLRRTVKSATLEFIGTAHSASPGGGRADAAHSASPEPGRANAAHSASPEAGRANAAHSASPEPGRADAAYSASPEPGRANAAHSASAEAEDLRRVTAAENAIWTAFERLPAYAQAHTVLLYAALPDEVATEEFIRRCSAVKRVVLPVVSGETLILREYDQTLLRPGYKDILEPSEDAPTVDPSEIDLAAIPGVAFTRNGGRLGRGKGFYDRLLPQLSCPTVGIAYPCQIVDALPLDPWDRLLDIVL